MSEDCDVPSKDCPLREEHYAEGFRAGQLCKDQAMARAARAELAWKEELIETEKVVEELEVALAEIQRLKKILRESCILDPG